MKENVSNPKVNYNRMLLNQRLKLRSGGEVFRLESRSLVSNTLRYKFSQMKISSLHWNGAVHYIRRTYGGKLPVSIKCHNIHSFKEGMILLCKSILETDEYHIYMTHLSLQSL